MGLMGSVGGFWDLREGDLMEEGKGGLCSTYLVVGILFGVENALDFPNWLIYYISIACYHIDIALSWAQPSSFSAGFLPFAAKWLRGHGV